MLGIPFPIWDRNQGNIAAAAAALIRAEEGPHAAEVNLTTNLAAAYATYKNNLFAMDYYRRNILPDQVRYYRGVFERRRIDPNAAFGDLVQAQQMLVADVTAYLGILGSLWTSVVDVADFLQTDDLYQLGKPLALPEVPDLETLHAWPCAHPHGTAEAAEVRSMPTPVPHRGNSDRSHAGSATTAWRRVTGRRRREADRCQAEGVDARPNGREPGSNEGRSRGPFDCHDFSKGYSGTIQQALRGDRTVVRCSSSRDLAARSATLRTDHAEPVATLERGKLSGRFIMNKMTHLLLAGAVAFALCGPGLCPGGVPLSHPPLPPRSVRRRSLKRPSHKRACRRRSRAVQTPGLARASSRRCLGRPTRRGPCSDRRSPPRRAVSRSMLLTSSPTRCSTPSFFPSPGWFAGAEVQIVKPHFNPRLLATACFRARYVNDYHEQQSARAQRDHVNMPAGTLDWTASPRVFAGYRLPQGFGEFMIAYRHLGTTGSRERAGYGRADRV